MSTCRSEIVIVLDDVCMCVGCAGNEGYVSLPFAALFHFSNTPEPQIRINANRSYVHSSALSKSKNSISEYPMSALVAGSLRQKQSCRRSYGEESRLSKTPKLMGDVVVEKKKRRLKSRMPQMHDCRCV